MRKHKLEAVENSGALAVVIQKAKQRGRTENFTLSWFSKNYKDDNSEQMNKKRTHR